MENSIKEALEGFFSDNPINWIKWAVVLIVFFLSFIPMIKIYKKLAYKTDKGKKNRESQSQRPRFGSDFRQQLQRRAS